MHSSSRVTNHHSGYVGVPGHVTHDGLVRLGGRLGELMLGRDLMASWGFALLSLVAGLTAAPVEDLILIPSAHT